jgi:hypothetical protein
VSSIPVCVDPKPGDADPFDVAIQHLGEIEAALASCLAHITPMTLSNDLQHSGSARTSADIFACDYQILFTATQVDTTPHLPDQSINAN